jgi:hypothetical protein
METFQRAGWSSAICNISHEKCDDQPRKNHRLTSPETERGANGNRLTYHIHFVKEKGRLASLKINV